MGEINLLARYPRAKRNIGKRATAKTAEHIRISRQYGQEYFDGSREYGYGGYRYDGRWLPIAEDLVRHFGLGPGDRFLDIGCAKGFLVKDIMTVCPGLEAFGLDVSEYALMHCEPEVIGRLHLGNATRLPFPDRSFKAAVAINVIHNLDRAGCILALRELQRVAQRCYVQVDSWLSEAQKTVFLDWVLTAQTYFDPAGWRALFDEAGYQGDYYWTITE